MRKYLLPEKGNFYKANMHAHTCLSDGRNTPEEVKEIFKSMGYSIVAYTDHNVFVDRSHLCQPDFLALNGVELDINGNKGKGWVDMETTHNPTNSRDAYQASLRSLLARNVGFFIVATFLTGTQRMVTWQGILHTVGSDYIVIYQPDYERYISCDFYALKFVQFHNTKGTPYCASSHTWMARDT